MSMIAPDPHTFVVANHHTITSGVCSGAFGFVAWSNEYVLVLFHFLSFFLTLTLKLLTLNLIESVVNNSPRAFGHYAGVFELLH